MAFIKSGLPAPRVETQPSSFKSSSLARILHIMGIRQILRDPFAESLRFSGRDTTAGTENNFQAVAWNIPVGCNRASTDFMISSPLKSEPYQRLLPGYLDLVEPKKSDLMEGQQ